MTKLHLTPELLNVICSFQAARTLFICEAVLYRQCAAPTALAYADKAQGGVADYEARAQNYFSSIPTGLIKRVGLTKNEKCFRALITFTVTKQILGAGDDQLCHHTFSY